MFAFIGTLWRRIFGPKEQPVKMQVPKFGKIGVDGNVVKHRPQPPAPKLPRSEPKPVKKKRKKDANDTARMAAAEAKRERRRKRNQEQPGYQESYRILDKKALRKKRKWG